MLSNIPLDITMRNMARGLTVLLEKYLKITEMSSVSDQIGCLVLILKADLGEKYYKIQP